MVGGTVFEMWLAACDPKPSAQLLWRAGAEERKIPRTASAYDSSGSGVSPLAILYPTRGSVKM